MRNPLNYQHLNRLTPSDVGLGFGKTDDSTAFLPLTAFLEQLHALETFQDVSRFAVIVLAPFRLRCCDIKLFPMRK